MIFLWDGPTTIFPFVGIFLLFWFEKRTCSRGIYRGLALSLTVVKPHVCYLVALYALVRWLKERDWEELFGFSIGSALLIVPTFLLLPSLSDFFTALSKVPSPLAWRTPTFSSFIQLSFHLPIASRWCFVVLAAGYTVWRGIAVKGASCLSTEIRAIFVPLSLITAPYAWTYDFVLLIFSLNFILERLSSAYFHERNSFHLLLAAAIVVANLCFLLNPVQLEYHWWYPVAIFCVSLLVCRNSRNADVVDLASEIGTLPRRESC